jgi:hypothetical protein
MKMKPVLLANALLAAAGYLIFSISIPTYSLSNADAALNRNRQAAAVAESLGSPTCRPESFRPVSLKKIEIHIKYLTVSYLPIYSAGLPCLAEMIVSSALEAC